MDETQFVRLLESVLAPDTERVKDATARLRENYYKSPAALSALVHLLMRHQSPQLRQLAAVEARTLVPKHWNSLPTAQKNEIRNSLLRHTLDEEAVLVRHSSARVVSAVAKIDLEDGEWADLPGFLQQAATSQVVRQREIGVYMLYSLIDVAGDGFVDRMSALFALFGQTIRDPESIEVRINTMLALGRMAMVLDADEDPESLAAFQKIFPSMVAVLKEVVEARDEDRTMLAFEVFQTLLGCDYQLMANYFRDVLQFMIDLATSNQLSTDARTQALSFLMQCVKYRKLKVQGLRLGEQLTLKALQITTELGELQNEDDDESTPGRSALALLDIMAQSLPPSQVVVPLLNALPPYVNSPDPNLRRAGVLALGFCVEGAPDFFGTQLKDVFPLVLRLLEDPDGRVRQAALYGLARLADELAEELGKQHEKLIPALVKIFDVAVSQANGKVDIERQIHIIKGTCGAIDSVFGGMEDPDAAKYAPALIPRLSRLFDQQDYKLRAAAISAVGTVAASSGSTFKPFFEPIVKALSPYVNIKDSDDELDLRGIVTEALGSIASAVGPIDFQSFVQPLMQASEEALHLGHPRLRETSFILWSTLAKVYGEDFAPFLEGVASRLLESLQQEENEFEVELGEEAQDLLGTEVTIAGKKIKVSAAEGDGNAVLSKINDNSTDDDDDVVDVEDLDENDDVWEELTGVTAVALEKEIALDVIADVVSHTRSKYLPYTEKSVELILGLVEHPYEGVRKSAISTLWRTYATLWAICEEGGQMKKWEPGLPLKVRPTQELVELAQLAMTATLGIWEDDSDRNVVAEINRNIAAVLKSCGPAIINSEEVVKKITKILVAILGKQHSCQQDLGEDNDMDSLQESSEYDWLVIDNALDVIMSLSTALGQTFAELWKIFEKPVLKYAGSSDAIERSSSIGAIAECMGNLKEAVTPFTSTLLKVLLRRLTDEDPQTKSNAAFAMGLLCEHSQKTGEIQQSYGNILSKVEMMFYQQEASMNDNAAGCVSRMILKHPDRVPLDDILPLLVDCLPLKQDYAENEAIWKMIFRLYQSSVPAVRGQTARLVPILAQVLSPPMEQLVDQTRSEVVMLVKYLHKQQPALIQDKKVLMEVVNSY
ncbi:MAG: hypothetical protein M1816_004558 [Peltula sp. TS41687]|nr:MAG: hypothetical protein M1816_004558 [Peltula sp. TS41687]